MFSSVTTESILDEVLFIACNDIVRERGRREGERGGREGEEGGRDLCVACKFFENKNASFLVPSLNKP